MLIGNQSSLRATIKNYESQINKLHLEGKKEESQKLANNLGTLSRGLFKSGIIEDNLTGQKYFVSLGCLQGGGVGSSNNVQGFNRDLLSLHGKDALNKVQSELLFLSNMRNCNRMSRIFIENNSSFALQYANCGEYSGYFFSDVIDAFQWPDRTLPPGAVGGILATKTSDTACGSVGYFSFRVNTEAKNYVVCCGFSTPYSGISSGGIEIRAEDGVLDGLGKIAGHGVTPTGAVTDINALVTKTYHATNNNTFHETSEICRTFKVHLQFANKDNNRFHYTITDR